MSKNDETRLEQHNWLFSNLERDHFHLTNGPGDNGWNHYVDIVDDEIASIFVLRWGVQKHSTKIERMLARESLLEDMERIGLRNRTSGM